MLDTNSRSLIVVIFIVAMVIQFLFYVLFLISAVRGMYYALHFLWVIVINAFLVFPLTFPLDFPRVSNKLKFTLPKIRQQIKEDTQLSKIVISIVKISKIFYLFLLAAGIILFGFFLTDVVAKYVWLIMEGIPYTLPENQFYLFSGFFVVTIMTLIHVYQSEASIEHRGGLYLKEDLSGSLEDAKTYLHLSRERLLEHPQSGICLLSYSLQKINKSFRTAIFLEISELPVAEHILDVISKLHPRAFCEKLVGFIDRILSAIEREEHGEVAIIISKFNSDEELEYTKKFKPPERAVLGIFKTIGPIIFMAITIFVMLFHELLSQHLTTPSFFSLLFFLVFVGTAFILSVKLFRHVSDEVEIVSALLHKARRPS